MSAKRAVTLNQQLQMLAIYLNETISELELTVLLARCLLQRRQHDVQI